MLAIGLLSYYVTVSSLGKRYRTFLTLRRPPSQKSSRWSLHKRRICFCIFVRSSPWLTHCRTTSNLCKILPNLFLIVFVLLPSLPDMLRAVKTPCTSSRKTIHLLSAPLSVPKLFGSATPLTRLRERGAFMLQKPRKTRRNPECNILLHLAV